MKKTIITNNPQETKELGQRIAQHLTGNMVLTLSGDLGAGKTTFTQGLAKGLNIQKTVNSPTFTILKSYKGDLQLHHIDAYRLEGTNQDLGFDDLLDEKSVLVIEWPQYYPDIDQLEALNIIIHRLDEEQREFTFESDSEQFNSLIKEYL